MPSPGAGPEAEPGMGPRRVWAPGQGVFYLVYL